jgi:hypothetical protein
MRINSYITRVQLVVSPAYSVEPADVQHAAARQFVHHPRPLASIRMKRHGIRPWLRLRVHAGVHALFSGLVVWAGTCLAVIGAGTSIVNRLHNRYSLP